MFQPFSLRFVPAALFLVAPLFAQFGDPVERNPEAAPVARALEKLGEDAQVFSQHVDTLSNPWMGGREPGTRGMELAREYFEHWLAKAGVEPPFKAEDGRKSYRQPFVLYGRREMIEQHASVGAIDFVSGDDFNLLGLGGGGEVAAPVVFVGYAVKEHQDSGYTSFPNDEQLDGKIALVLRYEPMDENGKSRWARAPRLWGRSANLSVKTREVARRNAVGMILVDPPGAADPRADELTRAGGGGRQYAEFPVVHMKQDAARRMLAALSVDHTLESLCAAVQEDGKVIEVGGGVTLGGKLEETQVMAENVAGLLPGRGPLKDEYIVIGGHLDHLGVGNYGARDPRRIGEIHPGADDNASGSAAVLMLADKLRRSYDELAEGASARSILFIGFDAEEQGLHGANHYVKEPLVPIEQHALMINFDMIGRIVNKRLIVEGSESAVGMREWLQPIFDASPLEIVTDGRIPGGSDHMAFMSREVPYLFSIIADFHDDYHTPEDVAWKINREDAVHTIHMYHEIAFTAATRSAPFTWQSRRSRER